MAGVKYEFSEHLIYQQFEAEQAMLAEFKKGEYTVKNPLVKYNAYLVNPLSAVILFRTEEEVAVTITVLGKTPQANLTHTFKKAKEHILPIVGLYNNYENKVEIRLYQGDTEQITIAVPDVFEEGDPIISMDTTPEYLQDNLILLSPAGEYLSVGYDYAGDARFHMNISCVFDVKRLHNGNLIMGSHRLLKKPYYMSGLYEISPCGKIYKEFRVPGGYHHDEFELENGDILCLTDDFAGETVEDCCVLLDRKTGEVKKTWDLREALDPMKTSPSGSRTEEDWFHNNAVWYDKNTNSLTFSGRHVDAMINIDYDSEKLNWILGDPTGWPEELVSQYFFQPIGSNFEWQYEQHASVITPEGDVMCFDNHHWGTKEKDKYSKAKDSFSRGVRYRIDTKAYTIEQVWQYGKDLGAAFFSPYISNVEYYEEGHYMVHSGGIAYKDGKPSDKLGALLKLEGGGQLYSKTIELKNNKKQLELQVHGNFYRAEKLPLYTNSGSELVLGKGQILGEMGVTKEFDIEIPAEETKELLPDSCQAKIIEEIDRFTLHSKFEKGQLVMLILEQEGEVHRYYISTAAGDFAAMCCGTFLDTDERNTVTSINKKGLSGTYKVSLIIDAKKYETGIRITC